MKLEINDGTYGYYIYDSSLREYMRDDGTFHRIMARLGGTYFNTREEAQSAVDRHCGASETGTLKELNVKAGDVVKCVDAGCIKWWTVGKQYTITSDGTPQDDEGHTYGSFDNPQPAVIFRIISRAPDTPKTWGDMTDAEKGALLLAHHDGKVIERQCGIAGWFSDFTSDFYDFHAYRVRPEHVREVVELWHQSGDSVFDTHRITFETVDGKPDCATIKMEPLS